MSGADLAFLICDYCWIWDIPVVFYSSNDEEHLRKSAHQCHVQGYICKGDVAGLLRIVGRTLGTDAPGMEPFPAGIAGPATGQGQASAKGNRAGKGSGIDLFL